MTAEAKEDGRSGNSGAPMLVVVGWAAELGESFMGMEPAGLSVTSRAEGDEGAGVGEEWRLPAVDVAAPGTSHGFGGDAIMHCENRLSSLPKLA